ncbi:hypothetical protein ACHAXR_013167 [Thalassiosira sp. AJA248-18]
MNSLSTPHRIPTRNLRPKKPKKQIVVATAPMPRPIPQISQSATSQHMKKPMRPLTAYHIFFQIEREHIIQTTAGPDADKSIHDNKSYIDGVPRRYRCTKLLPDWYFGPGKRQKRKHRKSHGKIGFLELSRVISKRWATLETTDPETKRYVTKIATRELEEYKVEMNEYKELTKHLTPATSSVVTAAATATVGAMISPSASPKFRPMDVTSSSVPLMMPQLPQPMPSMSASVGSIEEEEIDYSICSVGNNGNYIPSPSPPTLTSMKSNMIHPDGSICDPLFELDDVFSCQPTNTKRCVSPVSSGGMNVDDISGDDFLQLLC